MSKKEFLDGLCEQLSGQMPERAIQNHIRYYQEYIEEQIRNGKSEEDAVESLGSFQLIAKTLIDTETVSPEERYGTDDYGQYSSADYDQYEAKEYDVTYGDDFSSTHRQENDFYGSDSDTYDSNSYVKKHIWHIDLNTWYGKLLVVAIAILIIAALIFVIGMIVPVLIIVFLILTVVSYIKSRKWK